MASTNKTTNYELSQFVETDKPGWLTDYNGDMRMIDSNMKAISDVANGASGSVSSLEDRMTAAEGAITTNANDIDALEARADVLEAQAQSSAGTIAGIQTEQIAQNAGIEAATQLGYNLARPYDSASTYAVGDYVLFQNTLYKCVTAIATGEAFDPTKWLAIKATDEIAAGGYTLPIASALQLGGVKVGDNLSIDPVTGILSAVGGGLYRIRFIGRWDNSTPSIFQLRTGTTSTLKYKPLNNTAALTTSNITEITNSNYESIELIYSNTIAFLVCSARLSFSAITLGTSAPYYTKGDLKLELNPNSDVYATICDTLKDWEVSVRLSSALSAQFGKEFQTNISITGELTGSAITEEIVYAENSGSITKSSIQIAGVEMLRRRS